VTLERNAEALTALVAEDVARRSEAALAAARDEAARLLRDAHGDARRAMRAAYADERHRHRERVRAAQAALDSRERLALQRRNAALIAAGLQALPAALRARWDEPATRGMWVECALAQARGALPEAAWDVRHPAAWDAAERDAVARRIEAATGHAPAMIADTGLEAGLAIGCEGTLVDARVATLAADRARIGARLLCHAQAAGDAEAR